MLSCLRQTEYVDRLSICPSDSSLSYRANNFFCKNVGLMNCIGRENCFVSINFVNRNAD